MSKDYVITGELKYFHCVPRSDSSGGYIEITQGKKEIPALDFLKQLKLRLKDDFRIKVEGKTLKDVVDVVVSGCDAKVNSSIFGWLNRIWIAFQRGLVSLGFKRFSPRIDLIHKVADEIRSCEDFKSFTEFSPSGHSLLFFQKNVAAMVLALGMLADRQHDFFSPALNQLLEEPNFSSIDECAELAEILYPHYDLYEREYQRLNPNNIVSPDTKYKAGSLFSEPKVHIPAFDELFIVLAKEAYEEDDFVTAANYLAKVNYPGSDRDFIPDLIDQCLDQRLYIQAARALSKVALDGEVKWKLQQKVGLQWAAQENLTNEGIRYLLGLADAIKQDDEDSALTKAVIGRCLKDKRYEEALKAALSSFYTQGGANVLQLRSDYLIKICTACVENGDLAIALRAFYNIESKYRSLELHQKFIEACLKKDDLDRAETVANGINDHHWRTVYLDQIAQKRAVQQGPYGLHFVKTDQKPS